MQLPIIGYVDVPNMSGGVSGITAVSVSDFGALGNGADSSDVDTQAFISAAATGKNITMPFGEFHINAPISIPAGLIGSGSDGGQTRITLVGSGQLIVTDERATWNGFRLCSPEPEKVFVKCRSSFFKFHDFVVEKTGSYIGQCAVEFDTSANSIYFCDLDRFSINVDYPFRIVGNNTQVFNANNLSGDTGYVHGFQSAISISCQLAFDANHIGGYFETGINLINLGSGAFRGNRITAFLDNVTRSINTAAPISYVNYWLMRSSQFVSLGTVTNQSFAV